MKKTFKSIIWIVGIFIIFAVVANISYYTSSKSKPRKATTVTVPAKKEKEINVQKYENDIKILKDNGLLITINPQMNEAFIEPAIWNRLDYQTKQNIGRSIAFYCGIKKGTNLNWVDIKDRYSGKKVAKHSEAWGFKTY